MIQGKVIGLFVVELTQLSSKALSIRLYSYPNYLAVIDEQHEIQSVEQKGDLHYLGNGLL